MTHDIIIIGAGPAGMAAAITASDLGLKAVLLDEQPRAGGQIYRNAGIAPEDSARLLGQDYLHGKSLTETVGRADLDRHFSTTVWDVTPDLTVSAIRDGGSFQLRAPQIVVATGAMERASPLPGWTLPGVMNAGAAQIALKAGAARPAGRIVLVGGGPLLLLVACQLIEAGAEVSAVVETCPAANRSAALRQAWGALASPRLILKGLGLMARLKRAGVAWFTQATDVGIDGEARAEAVSFTCAGRRHRIGADMVLLHHGVVPNTQISRLLRVEHEWDAAQRAWRPRLDAFGETSRPGLRIAGDGGGIAGALAAEAAGTIAAAGAALALGRITREERDRMTREPRRTLRRELRIRPFLDTLYAPPDWITAPVGDTIVCRCEEVTATQIAAMTKLGCLGPNQTKFYSRCGMGPCQGRVCGLPVTGILARERGTTQDEIGAFSIRSPLKPVPLGAIARLAALQPEEPR